MRLRHNSLARASWPGSVMINQLRKKRPALPKQVFW